MKVKQLFVFILCLVVLSFSGCGLESDVLNETETTALTTMDDYEVIYSSDDETEESTSVVATTVSTTSAATTKNATVSGKLEVHYIDVGQADATLVVTNGKAMLIDGGNADDSSLIYSYLRDHGIKHLDYMICTHAHEDHVGGLPGALNYATVGTAFCPVTSFDTRAFNSFVKYLNNQGKSITVPSPGTTFSLGNAKCTILASNTYNDNPNNTSIVLRIVFGNTAFLFSGDAEQSVESYILNKGYDISCNVLKVPHHGSDSSSSYRWLREANADYAVISVGKNNSYGHPTENVLSKLRDADMKTFRTDMQGHIICTSDGNKVSFTVSKNKDVNTLVNPVVTTKSTTKKTTSNNTSSADYVLNTRSHKFHYPYCKSVRDMSEKNKQEVNMSRDEIIAQGYSPCGNCHP